MRTFLLALFVAGSLSTAAQARSDENWDQGSVPAYQVQKQGQKTKVQKGRVATRQVAPAATAAYASASYSSSSLVSEARRYIGTNPTGRRSLWCGAFMDLVLKRTGHKAGSTLASDYASYGRRVAGPQIGAIAVMSRGKNGGHVGVVSGIDSSGNVIVVSGNHNNTVAEAIYPRNRIYAYVMPSS